MKILNEVESENFLKKEGFPVVEREVIKTEEELIKVSKKLKFPLVLKITGISHKTDVGGVKLVNKEEELPLNMIAVDSVFTPIRKVNFTVEKARVGRATDFDKLVMEIFTDGSITPTKAVSQAASIIIEHFNLFIMDADEKDAEMIPVEQGGSVHAIDEDPVFNVNLLKSVEELELSVRSYNCLKNANIKTIADLVQRTEQEMLRTKNFGRKSLNEIKEILHGMGLRLGMRVDLDTLNKEAVLKSGGVEHDATQS